MRKKDAQDCDILRGAIMGNGPTLACRQAGIIRHPGRHYATSSKKRLIYLFNQLTLMVACSEMHWPLLKSDGDMPAIDTKSHSCATFVITDGTTHGVVIFQRYSGLDAQ